MNASTLQGVRPLSDDEKDFAALDHLRRARLSFESRICTASRSQDPEILKSLRFDSMFEFAEFYYTIDVMSLNEAEDIGILAEMHNERIDTLLKNSQAMRRRGLSKDRLLKAIFTIDTRPRLEHIWRERPGALDLSNLSRFLVTQMSSQTTRNLVEASVEAGFLSREGHAFGAIVVTSLGVMERVFGECLREMRLAIAQL